MTQQKLVFLRAVRSDEASYLDKDFEAGDVAYSFVPKSVIAQPGNIFVTLEPDGLVAYEVPQTALTAYLDELKPGIVLVDKEKE